MRYIFYKILLQISLLKGMLFYPLEEDGQPYVAVALHIAKLGADIHGRIQLAE
jgi:hypothetical protein